MTNRIFLDIDGVLADFVGGAARLHRADASTVRTWNFYEQWGLTSADFWGAMDYDFWVNLPLTIEAHAIVDCCERAVGSGSICLLTARLENPGGMEGARDWVRRHFPQFGRRLLLGPAKEFCASPSSLLVDDSDNNCGAFVLAGGAACLLPRPWNQNRHLSSQPLDVLRQSLQAFARSLA